MLSIYNPGDDSAIGFTPLKPAGLHETVLAHHFL